MSEFEKWWGKFDCSIDIDCAGLSCDNCEVIRKETWIAALEWIYNMFTGDYRMPYNAIGYEIGKELKQLNQTNSQSNNSPQSNTPGH